MFFHLSIKKAVVILALLAIVGMVIVFSIANNQSEYTYTTVGAKRGALVQTVSETGTVKAAEEISISFLNSGRIRKVYFEIGAQVNENDLLAKLDYSALSIKKEEAQANFDVAQGNLDKLLSGATLEEIEIARANVSKAQITYGSSQKELDKIKKSMAESISQAEKSLYDLKSSLNTDITTYEQTIASAQTTLGNTESTYQNAVDNKQDLLNAAIEDKLTLANTALDIFDRTINDEDGETLISVKAPNYLADAKRHNTKALEYSVIAKNSLSSAKLDLVSESTLEAADDCFLVLNETFAVLEDCYSALENSVTSGDFVQTELDALKANISAQQTLISAAITAAQTAKQNFSDAVLSYNTNVSTAEDSLATAQAAYDNAVITAENAFATAQLSGEQQIISAKAKTDSANETLSVAQAELNRIIAPANKYDVSLQQARIRQTQAVLDSINKQIDDSIIKSPISGVITKINYEEGEQAGIGAPVMLILGESDFEIEVLIFEADITKIEEKDLADITLDAFGEAVVFPGEVVFIEPAETIIQEVVYYKVKIIFDPIERIVKSGMTANVIITTAEKRDSLIIPVRAIIDRNGGGKFVKILENNEAKEKQVTTGLRGDEGMVEILSGINENDEVITHTEEK